MIINSLPLQFRTEQDKKSVCFICSLASHEFERRASGFDSHVKHDHNMWRYIYLSIYLDQIDISDHNAIQKFVYDMVSAAANITVHFGYSSYCIAMAPIVGSKMHTSIRAVILYCCMKNTNLNIKINNILFRSVLVS